MKAVWPFGADPDRLMEMKWIDILPDGLQKASGFAS